MNEVHAFFLKYVPCVIVNLEYRIKLIIHLLSRKNYSCGKEEVLAVGAVGLGFKFMSPGSNRINLKYDPYLFK